MPKTSGQGVSRLSYQKGRALGNKGAGVKDAPPDNVAATRSRSKAGKLDSAGGININYGDTINPTDLVDVEGYAKGKPAKGLSLTPKKSKKLK